ncbi:MAG: hypothetical protein ACYCUE_10030 [Steroidobacteraceae bacterium]
MKRLLVLLALCCMSGCASRRFCTGPMVPINRAAPAPVRHAQGAVRHARQRPGQGRGGPRS